nr:MAG TPA: hypothetical protein [Caudoviricetes sp.]
MKKFIYETYTEYHGNGYETTTKVYAVIPKVARDAIAKAEGWDGCHWDEPSVVYAESVEGTDMSAEALVLINALRADEYDDEEE